MFLKFGSLNIAKETCLSIGGTWRLLNASVYKPLLLKSNGFLITGKLIPGVVKIRWACYNSLVFFTMY